MRATKMFEIILIERCDAVETPPHSQALPLPRLIMFPTYEGGFENCCIKKISYVV